MINTFLQNKDWGQPGGRRVRIAWTWDPPRGWGGVGPGPENTARGRNSPIERWSRTPGWGGAGHGPKKENAGAGRGLIEKWSRTPGWGGVGRAPVQKTLQEGPHRKVVQNPYSEIFITVYGNMYGNMQAFSNCLHTDL